MEENSVAFILFENYQANHIDLSALTLEFSPVGRFYLHIRVKVVMLPNFSFLLQIRRRTDKQEFSLEAQNGFRFGEIEFCVS